MRSLLWLNFTSRRKQNMSVVIIQIDHHPILLPSLVSYSETIATNVPPTFRGVYVKYSYKLTIGTQRVNCPTQLIRVPFRVLVLPGSFVMHIEFLSRHSLRQIWTNICGKIEQRLLRLKQGQRRLTILSFPPVVPISIRWVQLSMHYKVSLLGLIEIFITLAIVAVACVDWPCLKIISN